MKLLNLFADKNLENTANSGGRSMVEMLGVLAIIGVLSVGGISGYSKAMYKHRMNKTIQTFSELFSNLIEVSAEKWEYGEIKGRQGILDYDLLSEEQCPVSSRDSNYCKFPLGEVNVDLTHNRNNAGDYIYGSFEIYFYEGDIVKSCVDFYSQLWQNVYPWELERVGATGDRRASACVEGRHNQSCRGGYTKEGITLSDIQTSCNGCQGSSYCTIRMYING